jgi:hypothetical protein
MKIAIHLFLILLLISCETNHPPKKRLQKTIDKTIVIKELEKTEKNLFEEGTIKDEDSNNVTFQFPILYHHLKYKFLDSLNRLKFEDSIDHTLKFKVSRNFKIAHKTWPKSEQNFEKAKLFLKTLDRSKLQHKGLYSDIYETIKIDIKTSTGYQSFFEFENFFQSLYEYDDHQEFLIKLKTVQLIYNKEKRNAVRIILKSPPGFKINREHTFDYVLIDSSWKLVARTYIDRVDAFYGNLNEPELFKWNYSPPLDKIEWDLLELE